MKKSPKFYGDGRWLKPLGFTETRNYQEADLLILPGGSDINPRLYGQKPLDVSHFHPEIDLRDMTLFKYFQANKRPILGICRGAQMSCALSGGQLYQDVNNHAGRNHDIVTSNMRTLVVNSLHHQMMNVSEMKRKDYDLLAWSEGVATRYLDDKGLHEKHMLEPEIVWFNNTNALAIQCHPEFGVLPQDTYQYLFEIVEEKILPLI